MHGITVENMIGLQNDVLDLSAQMILSLLLANLDAQTLILQERESYDELKSWNCECRADQIAPTIFAYWWEDLMSLIWSDDLHTAYGDLALPRADATIALILSNPSSPYFDIKDTPVHEGLKDLIVRSFHSANNRLFADLGRFGENWQWGSARPISILHLGQIRGMDRRNLFKGGSQFTVNVKHPLIGRSWRMVIALGPQMKGWGIYPGGQSGNPGSRFYDNFIDDWLLDRTYELVFLESPMDENERLIGHTVMRRRR
jgi:penicillin amidase